MRFLRCSLRLCALSLLAGIVQTGASAQVAPDSTASLGVQEEISQSLPSPKGALIRSLVAPGWGQIYVGQPVKTPFVIGALGGLVGLSIYFNGEYSDYRNAYLYVVNEPTPDPNVVNPNNPNAEHFDDWIATGAQSATNTRTLRDNNRRNRDLAILGTGLVYALQALDAYVSAELADFDVSEDLSLHALPSADGPQLVMVLRL